MRALGREVEVAALPDAERLIEIADGSNHGSRQVVPLRCLARPLLLVKGAAVAAGLALVGGVLVLAAIASRGGAHLDFMLPRPLGTRVATSGSQASMVQFAEEEPCKTACDIASGHRIRNQNSDRCLDWKGVIVKSFPCLGNKEQLWTYKEPYHVETSDGRCLDAGGQNVHIWTCSVDEQDSLAANQRFVFDPLTGQLKHTGSHDLCLEESGNDLSMKSCDEASASQKWHMHQTVQSGQIRHKHGLCLDAGGQIHMWPCDPSNENQHWTYDGSTGQLKTPSGECLDAGSIKGLKHGVWQPVMGKVRPCNPAEPNQQWLLNNRSGQVQLTNGNCLIAGKPDEKGSQVFLQACDPASPDQQWMLDGVIERKAKKEKAAPRVKPPEPAPGTNVGVVLGGCLVVLGLLGLLGLLFRQWSITGKLAVDAEAGKAAQLAATPPPTM